MSRITAKQYEILIAQLNRRLDYFVRLATRCKRLKMPSDYPLAAAADKTMTAMLELLNEAKRLHQYEIERITQRRKYFASFNEKPFPPSAA